MVPLLDGKFLARIWECLISVLYSVTKSLIYYLEHLKKARECH